MPSQEPVTESLAALSRFFVGEGTLKETLDRVARPAEEAVPAADFTGMTMLVEGRARTAVFTDETAPEIDSAQSGIGPCLDAFRHQEVYIVDDTAFQRGGRRQRDPEHPLPAARRQSRGCRRLNLYSRQPNGFADEDVELGGQFATQAAIVLVNAQAYWDAHQLSQDLATAMKSRATIEQAKGILMGAQRCNADEAFQMLVRASQRENRKLREVAEELVGRVQQPVPPKPPPR